MSPGPQSPGTVQYRQRHVRASCFPRKHRWYHVVLSLQTRFASAVPLAPPLFSLVPVWGSHFVSSAAVALQGACRRAARGCIEERTIIVANVLEGYAFDLHCARVDMKEPPFIPGTVDHFDSVKVSCVRFAGAHMRLQVRALGMGCPLIVRARLCACTDVLCLGVHRAGT